VIVGVKSLAQLDDNLAASDLFCRRRKSRGWTN